MKKSILTIVLFLLATLAFAQKTNYQLSSHILDISQGKPAAGVKILLAKQSADGNWATIDENVTDQNGRISNFLQQGKGISHNGVYKLTFVTAPYFSLTGQKSFYPFIEVVFEVEGNSHYHVPITLSAFGYATYRGN